MSNRELAAYLIASPIVLAVLIGWRIAALRRQRDRRSGYSRINLVGGAKASGEAAVGERAAREQEPGDGLSDSGCYRSGSPNLPGVLSGSRVCSRTGCIVLGTVNCSPRPRAPAIFSSAAARELAALAVSGP